MNNKEKPAKERNEDENIPSEFSLDDLISEISSIDMNILEEEKMLTGKEELIEAPPVTEIKGDEEKPLITVKKEAISAAMPMDIEEFNVIFDRELEDNLLSGRIEMSGKPNLPEIPSLPEIPEFPSIASVEKLLEGRIPEVPRHFTIEIPKEFDPLIPPEPLGSPPPPPVPPDIKT